MSGWGWGTWAAVIAVFWFYGIGCALLGAAWAGSVHSRRAEETAELERGRRWHRLEEGP